MCSFFSSDTFRLTPSRVQTRFAEKQCGNKKNNAISLPVLCGQPWPRVKTREPTRINMSIFRISFLKQYPPIVRMHQSTRSLPTFKVTYVADMTSCNATEAIVTPVGKTYCTVNFTMKWFTLSFIYARLYYSYVPLYIYVQLKITYTVIWSYVKIDPTSMSNINFSRNFKSYVSDAYNVIEIHIRSQ